MFSKTIKPLWRAWCRLLEKVGRFQLRLMFTVLFFTFVVPFSWIVKSESNKRFNKESSWLMVKDSKSNIEQARRQF